MSSLFNDIEKCGGKEHCFGKVIGKIRPIVFSFLSGTIKIMVITEQPRLDRVNREMLKTALQEDPKNSIPWRLKELLGDEFCKSIINENGIFYWTHYIKCPGEFRKSEKKIDIDKCADMYLEREIEHIKPSLIISIGGRCSSWILKRFKSSLSYGNEDWREHIWRELTTKEKTKIKVNDIDIQVIFLIHPSERSGIGWFIDRKLKNIIQESIEEVKR